MSELLKGRYLIIEELREGGFGKTFLAEDTDMPSRRRCVIKQFKPAMRLDARTYEIVRKRFEREASLLEELGDESNKQIPKLYAFFADANEFYIVQELIEGITLEQKVEDEGALDEHTVREMLVNLLPVLVYTHSKNVIHRDIKPSNIIIRQRDNKPVLIDFGAVKEVITTVLDAHGTPVRTSLVIGTPGYIPLEQARGLPVYSSDLYSLGITAIISLTGQPPQDLLDYKSGEIRWQSHAPHVSPGLAAILNRVIQSDYLKRYATAEEMLEALRDHIREETEKAAEREAKRARETEKALKKERIVVLYAEALADITNEKLTDARRKLKEVLSLDATHKDAAAKMRQVKQLQDLDEIYERGKNLYQNGNLEGSLECFRKVQSTQSNYKDVPVLIKNISYQLNRKAQRERQARLDELHRDANIAIASENWSTAVDRLQALLKIEPANEEAARKLNRARQQAELLNLYNEGQAHARAKRWRQALVSFQKITLTKTGYKDVESLIAKAQRELAKRQSLFKILKFSGISFVLLSLFSAIVYKTGCSSPMPGNINTSTPVTKITPAIALASPTVKQTPSPSPSPSPKATPMLLTVKMYLKYDTANETILVTLNTSKDTVEKNPDEGNPIVFNNIPCGQNIQLSAVYSYNTIEDKPIDNFYRRYLDCSKPTVDLGKFRVLYDKDTDLFSIEPY